MSAAPRNELRCEFAFSDGRRCRLVRRDPGSHYCYRHWRCEQQKKEAARVGDEIVGAEGALNTEEGIHKALTNVFASLARKRISARDASVLGYVGQLMLISRPSVERTYKAMLPMLQLSFKIGQRDKDANIKSSREVLKNALLEQEVINGMLAQSEAFRKLTPQDLLAILKFGSMFSDKPFTPPGAKSPPAAASTAAPPAETQSTASPVDAKSDSSPTAQPVAAPAKASAKKSA